MFDKRAKVKRQNIKGSISCSLLFTLCFLLVLAGPFCLAGESWGKSCAGDDFLPHEKSKEVALDPTQYITIDEIQPGMKAYCLTTYKGTKIEKFNLDVVSVVRNVKPGRDAILVQGTDERFIHTGPVAGCSGSPVYINGRLAGALAFGWTFSKDPLYGVTPIEEMLKVGKKQTAISAGIKYVFDFSEPINFTEIYSSCIKQDVYYTKKNMQYEPLPCPLITSGLPADVCKQLGTSVEPFGIMAVTSLGSGTKKSTVQNLTSGTVEGSKPKTVELVPGACLAVPLVSGDITMTAIGTVTEIVGDKVYGFGHSFLGYGPIDLPMATGQVHTVVSSIARSFKFASALETVGALTADESAAVRGQIGVKAKMIPLAIEVSRYNDTKKRVYNCQVANNQILTPRLVYAAVGGAALYLGDLPIEHTIEYKVVINLENAKSIIFENISTGFGLVEMMKESISSLAILMNNPYEKINIKSIYFDIHIVPKKSVSHIWSVNLSDSKVKVGQVIEAEVVVESVLTNKKKYQYRLKIPDELTPGRYDFIVCGGHGYQEFLKQAVPYRFIPQNMATLLEAMNDILSIKRDELYCLLVLPPSGVAVEKAELPSLPATRTMVLQDAKRTLKLTPYSRWLERKFHTGTTIIDKKTMYIMVEE